MDSSKPQPKPNRLLKKIIVGILLIFLIWMITGRHSKSPDNDTSPVGTEQTAKATVWTCAMHPQIRQPEPGRCPICAMALIPAGGEEAEGLGPRMMSISEESIRLAEIQMQPVERRFVDLEIPLVGKIDYDETRVKTISSWVPGRLERLFVDYTGIPVKEGDHLVEIYSPELYSGQEELLQAIKSLEKLQESSSKLVKESTEKNIAAAREKLKLLGLNPEQIQEIETSRTPSATVEIDAPLGGVVIKKIAEQGAYVKTGTPIYQLADLSTLWVKLNAYESDVARLRYGQEVEILTEAYGDRIFPGWISFIDPILNPKTRTVEVRVVVNNSDGLLRPNMFAKAKVKVRLGENEEVVTRNLQGKWISPMHPEVIKDHPGKCDVCGMDLVKAEDLGYKDTSKIQPALVAPASAVLTTGERAIVYVQVPGKEKPTFQGVEIKVGAKAGDYYLVNSGLTEGQNVVTNGNFKIDSALQLMAKPSMMDPQGEGSAPMEHVHQQSNAILSRLPEELSVTLEEPQRAAGISDISAAFRQQLQPLYDNYLKCQQALAADNEQEARQAIEAMVNALGRIDMELVKGEAHMQWMTLSSKLREILEQANKTSGIVELRKYFITLSKLVINLEKTFGHIGEQAHSIAFCPMADSNKGAEWLQIGDTINNPYYGTVMLRCGEIRQTIPAQKTK
ncbi:MAG: efflux RND transporter periplasmic adaptor subunit [Planctomycetes bacterium]|nr:efflux RND transporter periplasmic adaptor subunit [Planctomycetota bacterium]